MKLKIKETFVNYNTSTCFDICEKIWCGWRTIATFYNLEEAEKHCINLLLEKKEIKSRELISHTYELFGNKILKDDKVIETIQDIY